MYFMMRWLWDYSFNALAKFSEKLIFLTPWYAHVRMIPTAKGGRRLPDLEKKCLKLFREKLITKAFTLKIVNSFKSNLKSTILNNRNCRKHILNSFVILTSTIFMKCKKIPLKTFSNSALCVSTKIFWIDSAWNKTTTFHINGFLFSGNQSDYTRY